MIYGSDGISPRSWNLEPIPFGKVEASFEPESLGPRRPIGRVGAVEPQIDRLLAAGMSIPGDTHGPVDYSTEGDTKAFLVRL
jgi:hypothetical protein